eukprot:GHVU01127171.1.p2 GENE.GHVU01127171.1~~GHVU01127171.1.p2  ORF type:complete len:122 (-),score=16.72 GHVU01127171.1:696-1061(-)
MGSSIDPFSIQNLMGFVQLMESASSDVGRTGDSAVQLPPPQDMTGLASPGFGLEVRRRETARSDTCAPRPTRAEPESLSSGDAEDAAGVLERRGCARIWSERDLRAGTGWRRWNRLSHRSK